MARRDEDYDEAYEDEPRPRRRRREYDEDDEEEQRPRRRRMKRADLEAVAWYQKIIIFCILGYIVAGVASAVLRAQPGPIGLLPGLLLGVYALAVIIAATVFVFMLALKLYTTGVGVTLGILTLIPCVGLIILLVINQKATSVLKQNGVRVGLFGANMNDLR